MTIDWILVLEIVALIGAVALVVATFPRRLPSRSVEAQPTLPEVHYGVVHDIRLWLAEILYWIYAWVNPGPNMLSPLPLPRVVFSEEPEVDRLSRVLSEEQGDRIFYTYLQGQRNRLVLYELLRHLEVTPEEREELLRRLIRVGKGNGLEVSEFEDMLRDDLDAAKAGKKTVWEHLQE